MAKVLKRSLAISLGLAFFLTLYPVRIAKYCWERLFNKEVAGSISVGEVFAEVFCTSHECVATMFPGADNTKSEIKVLTDEQKKTISKAAEIEFDPELDKEYRVYIAESKGQVIGYCIEDTVKGKWGPINYMLAIEPDGKIKDVIVMALTERRGRPVKERRFLNQFAGKTMQNPIKLNKDIKGVAGATISSRGMSNGIRKITYVFNELYKK